MSKPRIVRINQRIALHSLITQSSHEMTIKSDFFSYQKKRRDQDVKRVSRVVTLNIELKSGHIER